MIGSINISASTNKVRCIHTANDNGILLYGTCNANVFISIDLLMFIRQKYEL